MSLENVLFLTYIQNSNSYSTGNGVASKSVEMECLGHGGCNGRCGDHSSQGKTITYTLGHSHYVWDDIMTLKAPKVVPSPTKTTLYLKLYSLFCDGMIDKCKEYYLKGVSLKQTGAVHMIEQGTTVNTLTVI